VDIKYSWSDGHKWIIPWIRREGERARPPASHVHTPSAGARAEAAEEVRSTPQIQKVRRGTGEAPSESCPHPGHRGTGGGR